MVGSGPLTSESVAGLLDELDRELHRAGGRAELYLAGGARMLLGWRTDRRTSDLDGVMRTGQTMLMTAAMKVGRRHGLEPTWVNPAVTYFVPSKPDPGETALYNGKALTVKGASAEHMLAMKIRSHRDIDLNDAKVLIDRLKLTSTREIQRIAEDAYEGHGADNRKMIQQGLNRIAETMPELAANHFAGEPQEALRPPNVKRADREPAAETPPQPPSTESAGPSKGQQR